MARIQSRPKKKLPEKALLSGAMIESGSAVQGIDSGLGVCDVELLDVSNLAQTGDLAIDRVEFAGCLELALPGILVVASHIVVGVVTCNDHQGTQDDLGVTGGLDSSMTFSQAVSSGSPSTVPMKTFL